MKEINLQEIWQIDVGGQIYETSFQEMTQWISEGSVLPQDKVRRGNLRWIEAQKVPLLIPFFNAKEQGAPPPVLTSVSDAEGAGENSAVKTENFAPGNIQSGFNQSQPADNFYAPADGFSQPETSPMSDFCLVHTETKAKFVCDTCLNGFCAECTKNYGGSVRICPMCGSMCQSIEKRQVEAQKSFQYQQDLRQGFGFGDFGDALFYPLKYKSSYVIGAIFFMFFTIGQSAAGLGSMFLVAASLTCFMLSNMLTFGILAHVTESFSQGKIGGNFMPGFDDFDLWDDMVKPFFLSIAVYIVSFGLMIVLIIGSVWYMFNQISSTMPQFSSNPMASQVETANKMKDFAAQQNRRGEMYEEENYTNRNFVPQNFQNANGNVGSNGYINREEEEFAEMEKMINQTRKGQLESTIGKTPETEQAEMREMAMKIVKTGGIFMILIFLAFLWGVFYFPAACCVAGYTRSVRATLNPSVGLDTIKRLGADYWKILLMGLILVIFSVIVSIILNIIFFPFNLPRMGNLPAIAVGSWFTFYISIVFSLILGFALYKNAEKMKLFR